MLGVPTNLAANQLEAVAAFSAAVHMELGIDKCATIHKDTTIHKDKVQDPESITRWMEHQ